MKVSWFARSSSWWSCSTVRSSWRSPPRLWPNPAYIGEHRHTPRRHICGEERGSSLRWHRPWRYVWNATREIKKPIRSIWFAGFDCAMMEFVQLYHYLRRRICIVIEMLTIGRRSSKWCTRVAQYSCGPESATYRHSHMGGILKQVNIL